MGAPWRARALNAECLCGDLDRARLAHALDGELAPGLGAPGLAAQCAAQPTLFADAPVFLPRQSVAQMHALVATVEAAAALPAWRRRRWPSWGRQRLTTARWACAWATIFMWTPPAGPA